MRLILRDQLLTMLYNEICVMWLQSVLQYKGKLRGLILRDQLLTMLKKKVTKNVAFLKVT